MSNEALSEYEYNSIHGYDRSELRSFEREMERGGWDLYDYNISRTSSYYSVAYRRRIPLDQFGFTDEDSRRADEVAVLKLLKKFKETGVWDSLTVYTNCAHYLFKRNFIAIVDETMQLTEIGLQALTQYENN